MTNQIHIFKKKNGASGHHPWKLPNNFIFDLKSKTSGTSTPWLTIAGSVVFLTKVPCVDGGGGSGASSSGVIFDGILLLRLKSGYPLLLREFGGYVGLFTVFGGGGRGGASSSSDNSAGFGGGGFGVLLLVMSVVPFLSLKFFAFTGGGGLGATLRRAASSASLRSVSSFSLLNDEDED